MTREEAGRIYDQGREAVIAVLLDFDRRLRVLEDRLAKTSRNSSKPPSSDGLGKPAPKPAPGKELSDRKPGGQPDHPGSTLERREPPDAVVELTPSTCARCAQDLTGQPLLAIETRQVLDLPDLRLLATAYQAAQKCCPGCGHVTRTAFPAGVSAFLQYGPRVRALALYLKDRHLVPSDRTTEILADVFGCSLSEGTLATLQEKASAALEAPLQAIREQLRAAPVIHVDETSCRVKGKNHWLHGACTPVLTLLGAHPRRGAEGTEALGVLPDFRGTAVHDFWAPYGGFSCAHSYCNAHLLRELTFVSERTGQPWAQDLITLLLAMNGEVQAAPPEWTRLPEERTAGLHQQYRDLVAQGLGANPEPPRRWRPPSAAAASRWARSAACSCAWTSMRPKSWPSSPTSASRSPIIRPNATCGWRRSSRKSRAATGARRRWGGSTASEATSRRWPNRAITALFPWFGSLRDSP